MQSFPTNTSNPQCVRYQCIEASHATCIERSYGELNAKIIGCGRKVFGTTTHKRKNILGWNLYVKHYKMSIGVFFSYGEAMVVHVKMKQQFPCESRVILSY